MKCLPNNSLRTRSDRFEILIPLQDSELCVPDLDRVEHGGQPGCHFRPQVRHAPRCSPLLHLDLYFHSCRALLVHSTRTYALSHFGHWD